MGIFTVLFGLGLALNDHYKANFALFFLSLAILYFLIELIIFPLSIRYLPLRFQANIPEGIRILCQSSKEKKVPKEYIAIFGDSYAQGFGDWFINTNKWKNKPYHSAHIINTALKRDVISFGSSGASIISGMVVKPLRNLHALRSKFQIADPKQIIIYFYEGNDLDDTYRDLQLREPKYSYAYNGKLERQSFFRHLDNIVSQEKRTIRNNFIFLRFIKRSLITVLFNSRSKTVSTNVPEEPKIINENYESIDLSNGNIAFINNEYRRFKRGLQGPSLQLTESEINDMLKVFEYCLNYIIDKFPNSKISLVYIPSPLSCYQFVSSVNISGYHEGRPLDYSSDFCRKRSSLLKNSIKNITAFHNIKFINPIEDITTSNEILHGPIDYKHFNKRGYEVLSNAIIKELR
tara:strand:- start:335 stop:1549 length:1215 start_codon:yes stop_codon:yes gene_type:complete